MRFRKSAVCLALLLGGLSLHAQQPGVRSAAIADQCLGQPRSPRDLRPKLCKPVLPGARSQQPADNFPRYDDGTTYVSFDVPGAVNGLSVAGIDLAGNVAGSYNDANFLSHGFVRHPDGTILSFDDPNAVYGTFVFAMSDTGVVTGGYWDINQQFAGQHGFLRTPDGTYVTFDAPNDVNGTGGNAINLWGAIAGNYYDANFVSHGFVRDPFGTITTFDVPGSQSTLPSSINLEGTVVGQYFDANGSHGFQRTWDGTITTFDVPGGRNTAYYAFGGGSMASINVFGTIATNYFQPIQGNPFGGNHRGAVSRRNGTYDTFDASTSGPCCTWTYPIAITPDGTTTGYDNDGYDIYHGFVRTPAGAITLFDVPGAGTRDFQGTVPLAINAFRVIVGTYTDSNYVTHGFLRIPQ